MEDYFKKNGRGRKIEKPFKNYKMTLAAYREEFGYPLYYPEQYYFYDFDFLSPIPKLVQIRLKSG